jgi:hypothetical protein
MNRKRVAKAKKVFIREVTRLYHEGVNVGDPDVIGPIMEEVFDAEVPKSTTKERMAAIAEAMRSYAN